MSEDEDVPEAGMLASLLCGYAAFALAMRGIEGRVIVIAQTDSDAESVGYVGATGYGTDDPGDREAALRIISDAMDAINALCGTLGVELIQVPGRGLGPRREG